jgi:hypothetical protein
MSSLLLAECQMQDLHYLSEVDPEGGILVEKLNRLNEDALYEQFQEIGESLVRVVADNVGRFEREHSLMALKDEISKEVNRVCSSSHFQLRLQQARSSAGSTLWETMHEQLMEAAMGITGFMHNLYEMALSEERRETEVYCFLQAFR